MISAAGIRLGRLSKHFVRRILTISPEPPPLCDLLPRLSDAEMLDEYRQADLWCMPMLDSDANNVFLKSMACGTLVMSNRVGGVPECVADNGIAVMPADASVDDWGDRLSEFERDRNRLKSMRGTTRAWAERYDWNIIAERYLAMYRELLGCRTPSA